MAGSTGSPNHLQQLESTLESFVENVRQLGIVVADFQPQGQPALNQKITTLVGLMQDIERVRPHVEDIQVPLEVCDYIDEGRNPQLYTKDCMEKALAKNEQVKGKIDAYRRFKALLIVELNKVFPHEMNKYRAYRGENGLAPPPPNMPPNLP
ncbi:mediator of RNA polymerase II transcription subunit 10-like [Varroa jacobsoni]|uniref:Mediator of RNA polymerase II transcription subunit 10 n=1 Tax=Varroa destructor TaxID=109461 RepID=A0A7M7J8G6_VARDE|nr:mediator of RNA polymerase II transcription subunit 10-like [Varroa destructor]XP_022648300.1 mediator of RNA polymerase II transcription subunit 10-like [Varroa destructor]XP_022691938.1 mediator of RNA polymerase II transcription subunit 10-like [Varroa jacobsoni]XP_022691939.1 mediator of RNA polymerase II transcription subunit 10-like [Varroa jacobsoni]